MGKAIIKENLGLGYYKIELVIAMDRVDAELVGLNNKLAELNSKYPTGDEEKDNEFKIAIASVGNRIAYLDEKLPENLFMNAFCVDFSDSLAIDSEVGTIEAARTYIQILNNEVEGEYESTYGIWIRPGFSDNAAYSAERDGIINPPINQNPWQLYYNEAMTPGTQKWKPRYRYGLIERIEGDYCDVLLEDLVHLTDDKTEIDIDQELDLTAANGFTVAIEYMDCDGEAFAEGDQVVVEFSDYEWSSPKVIGFTGDPQECPGESFFAVVFTLPIDDAAPASVADVYTKLYLKANIDGSTSWVSEAEASSNARIEDTFDLTTNFPSTPVYEFTKPNSEHIVSIASGMSFDKYWEEYYPDGINVPGDWGTFKSAVGDLSYGSNRSGSRLSTIGGLKVFLFANYCGVGVVTKSDGDYIPGNYVRTIDTETWEVEEDGAQYADLALLGRIAYNYVYQGTGISYLEIPILDIHGNVIDYECEEILTPYSKPTWWNVWDDYGRIPGAGLFYFKTTATWLWGNTAPTPPPFAEGQYNGLENLVNNYLDDPAAFLAEYDHFKQTYVPEALYIYGKDLHWTESYDGSTKHSTQWYWFIGDNGNVFCPDNYTVWVDEDYKHNSGYLRFHYYGSSLQVPSHVYHWDDEREKDFTDFPISLTHRSGEADDFKPSVSSYHGYESGGATSAINSAYYRDLGDGTYRVVTKYNTVAASGSGSIQNRAVAIINKTSGNIVSYNSFESGMDYDPEQDTLLPLTGVYPPQLDLSVLLAAINAKKTELGASGAYMTYLVKK